MRARMTTEMLQALRETPEIPDILITRVDSAQQDGDAFLITLTDDEAMAMVEMCQWYIHSDPETGQLTPKAQLFDAIVTAVDEAQA
ncbi:MAG: hypothetical protein GTN62_04790 [Gemmatimonadales bacterium]|nr:hypothetical protein [Gemmatimonadales bacterium]NIN10655.1 hypothetical protein [Gemmatimonadales bacterium]NIN49417.1 hypothetical protein [Gemmatimonadales bacterium]NIP06881.1 hypothetical protein [Gemmatimonadales bacterium]NIR01555.1 hypothetical protein [Gemmatimonadales bacterium]